MLLYGEVVTAESRSPFLSEYTIYIDRTTRKLLSRYSPGIDPSPAQRVTPDFPRDKIITYEDLKLILSKEKNKPKIGIEDASEYESLNEDNGKEWLMTHNLMKEEKNHE